MDHLMLVKNLFNDMFVFLNGTQPLPLESLDDVYQGEPLFLALIGGLDQALLVDYNSGRELTEEEWEQVVEEIQMFIDKWNNSWCKGMILALLALMEQEEDERKGEGKMEQAESSGDEELDSIDNAA